MYLADSSAIWRLQRDPEILGRWRSAIESGEIASCGPQRIEMLRSARNEAELDDMGHDLQLFYPDVPVPKGIWRWIDSAQHQLVRAGALRAFSVVDLLVCGVAALHTLTVLHDDHDFETAGRFLADVRQQRV